MKKVALCASVLALFMAGCASTEQADQQQAEPDVIVTPLNSQADQVADPVDQVEFTQVEPVEQIEFAEIEPFVIYDDGLRQKAKENTLSREAYDQFDKYLRIIHRDGSVLKEYESSKIFLFCATQAEADELKRLRESYTPKYGKSNAYFRAIKQLRKTRQPLSYVKLRQIQKEMPEVFPICWQQIMYEYPLDDRDFVPGGESWDMMSIILKNRDNIGRHFGIDPGHISDTKQPQAKPEWVADHPFL
jgi:outer membrane murein-binding lipoprotein Lpp